MTQHAVQSQIFIFETMQDFARFVDDTIHLYKSQLEGYEGELGQMLRQAPQDSAEAERSAEIQDKLTGKQRQSSESDNKNGKEKAEKTKQMKKEKKEKRKERRDKKRSTNWRNYQDIQIFTGNANQGKIEVFFEAVNELKATLEKLDRIKEGVAQLTSIGLGNVLYLVYTKNSIPENLVILPQVTQEGKFEFKADFVTEGMEVPIESRQV